VRAHKGCRAIQEEEEEEEEAYMQMLQFCFSGSLINIYDHVVSG
jgi:hypothetical protein